MQSILETCQPRSDILTGSFNPEIFTASLGLDHGVGHFWPLSITRQRHLLAYHGLQ